MILGAFGGGGKGPMADHCYLRVQLRFLGYCEEYCGKCNRWQTLINSLQALFVWRHSLHPTISFIDVSGFAAYVASYFFFGAAFFTFFAAFFAIFIPVIRFDN
jgi:hypothetical protein